MTSTTKQRIADAFLELAQRRSLQKINVSQIVRAAEISRGTFYHHFVDIQDLINWIYHQEVTLPFREAIVSRNENLPDLSLTHVQALYRRRDYYCQAFRMEGQGTLCDYARNEIQENWTLFVEHLAAEYSIDEPARIKQMKVIAGMIAMGSYNSLVEWARRGMLTKPEQLCRDMDQIILPFIERIITGS